MGIMQSIILTTLGSVTEILPLGGAGNFSLFGGNLTEQQVASLVMWSTLGICLAILLVFMRDIRGMASHTKQWFMGQLGSEEKTQKSSYVHLFLLLLAAVSPFFFAGVVRDYGFNAPVYQGMFFIISGILIYFSSESGRKLATDISYFNSFLIGCFGLLSIFMGISVIATSIFAANASGFNKRFAIKFAMLFLLLTSPIIWLVSPKAGLLTINPLIGILCVVISAFLGIICIKLLEKLIVKGHYKYLSFYCFAVGAVVFVMGMM